MANVKDLRDKPLSEMTADELRGYIDTAEKSGYSLSESKDLGKAQDLLKVLEPDKYGSETVESAEQKLLTNTTPQTQQKLGIAPTTAADGGLTNTTYDAFFNTSEINQLKADIDEKKKARDIAVAKINDNPFYSEATRVGKINQINQQADAEIGTLQEGLNQLISDAEIRYNIATQQYNVEQDRYKNALSQLNLLIDTGAISNLNPADLAELAKETGLTVDMLKQIQLQTAEKGSGISPQVITQTDNDGNVTAVVIDKNTGNIINKQNLGQIGEQDNVSKQEIVQLASEEMNKYVGGDGHVSETTYLAARDVWTRQGFDPADFDAQFAYQYVNPSYYESYKLIDQNALRYFSGT